MSRRSRLQIGSLYFSSRSAAEEFYKKIKDSYESQAGEPIAEESAKLAFVTTFIDQEF